MSEILTPEEFAKELDGLIGKQVTFEWCIDSDEYGNPEPVWDDGEFLRFSFKEGSKDVVSMEFVLKRKYTSGNEEEIERYYTYVSSPPFEDKIFKDELMGDDYYRMGCSETSDFYAAIRVPK